MNQNPILNTIIQQLTASDISFIPIKADGSKSPALSQWKEYQRRCPSAEEIATWFKPDSEKALAVITGAVSKNLELIDIDAKDIEPKLRELLTERGLVDLLDQMPCVQTPDGFHYYFSCSQVEGNQKLAQRYVDGKCRVLIETRGEGGYAIAPGSPLSTHPTRRPYELAAGSFDNIPVLSPQQREAIFGACRELDETAGNSLNVDGVRRSFNESADWDEILEPHGFTLLRTQNGEGFWRKPDSSDPGHQLTTNYNGSDRLYNFSSACPPFEQEQPYDKFSAYALLNQNGVEKAAAHDLFNQGYSPSLKAETKSSGKFSLFQQLLDLAHSQEIWLDQKNEVYVTVRMNQHWEHYPLNSPQFKHWLRRAYYESARSGVSDEPISQVVGILSLTTEGLNKYASGIRVAWSGDCIYYDLCNDQWEYVEISRTGWSIRRDPGQARFIRTPVMMASPSPLPGTSESVAEFAALLNIDPELDQPNLLLAFMLDALVPKGPHPLLVIRGEQGSGKSLTATAIKTVLDPALPVLIAPPRDEDELVIVAKQRHLIAFDNISRLKSELSDAFCRLSTGGGLLKRKLYSDYELVAFNDIRPVILNGIDDIAEKNDLIERSIIFDLPVMPEEKRMPEEEFFQRLRELAPKVLGLLFDALSCMLRELPTTRLLKSARMADFVHRVTAASSALGWDQSYFQEVYSKHQDNITELRLNSDPVVDILGRLLWEQDFSGTATKLFSELRSQAQTEELAGLPNSASTLGRCLRRLAPALRRIGIEVSIPKRSRQRNIVIRKARKVSVDADDAVDVGGADKIL